MSIRAATQPTQRTLDALETRNKIYETSVRLFAEYGFDTVTISDIAERVGVSKGTFYVHFPSKDSILLELFSKIDQQYEKKFPKLPPDDPAAEKILALMHTMCDYCQNSVGLELLQVVYSCQASSKKTDRILMGENRTIYRLLRRLHREGVENREFNTIFTDEEFADYIMRSARGLIFDWCMTDGSFDLIEEGDSYFRLMLKLVLN